MFQSQPRQRDKMVRFSGDRLSDSGNDEPRKPTDVARTKAAIFPDKSSGSILPAVEV